MKIFERLKGVSNALLYSIIGIVVMNGVLQFVVYPYLNIKLGPERFGTVLTLLSVVAIVSVSLGTGANYSRMLAYTRKEDSNGDYNRFLLYACLFSIAVSLGVAKWAVADGWSTVVGYCFLMAFSIVRYYADVEFRLRLNYKRYCIYYILIALGCLLGILIYPLSNSWALTILLGELAAVIFVKVVGNIFTGDLTRSVYHSVNMKSWLQMAITQFVTISVLHMDRIMLQALCGGTSVTVFYAATLVGKMVALVSTPLNSVLIGYLSKYEGKFSGKTLWKICWCSIPLGLLINVVCTGGAYIFVRWMYGDIFEMVRPYLWLASAGQVFYFIAGTLMVVIMRFAGEKYQVYISVSYMILFLVLAIPMTMKWEIRGMAWALLIGNLLQIFLIAVVGRRVLS